MITLALDFPPPFLAEQLFIGYSYLYPRPQLPLPTNQKKGGGRTPCWEAKSIFFSKKVVKTSKTEKEKEKKEIDPRFHWPHQNITHENNCPSVPSLTFYFIPSNLFFTSRASHPPFFSSLSSLCINLESLNSRASVLEGLRQTLGDQKRK